jgi:glycosyltransferase involved in cell wall biosynthesis
VSARGAVLLSTYNGARFLGEQLGSLLAQQHADWTLFWRDDGSADATPAIMAAFAARLGAGRCVHVANPAGNLGVRDSFLTLLRAALPTLDTGDAAAFCDQDDVWLPEKLARGVAALAGVPDGTPALYCARQTLTDANLKPIGLSPPFNCPPGFPAALTQNIATGCTILLNRAAARLVAGSSPPAGALHDWWCYLLVSAAGGRVLTDDTPVLLYRQHGGNVVGARPSLRQRAVAAARRGPGPFMADFKRHLNGLAAHASLLTPHARRDVATLQVALAGSRLRRLAALRMPGLRRAQWSEGLLFRLWFLIG